MNVIDRTTAEHYLWADVCDGWHLLKRDELSVIAERVPAGARETRHLHTVARQFFYILDGVATMEMNGEHLRLQRGQGLEVPPGTPHQFINETNADVHFLVISQPTTRGDRTNL